MLIDHLFKAETKEVPALTKQLIVVLGEIAVLSRGQGHVPKHEELAQRRAARIAAARLALAEAPRSKSV